MSQIVATPQQRPAFPEAPLAHRGRLPFIDGLRGLAMLMVLTYHCWVHTIQAPIWLTLGRRHLDLTAPLHLGYLGVHLFLVLSGFCLTYPLARDGVLSPGLDLRRFFRRRAWRILPPYYAALALFSLLPLLEHALCRALGLKAGGEPPPTMGQIVSHLLMVHNFSLYWMGAINASFWSLALEWQLYLIFPLLVWSFRRWGPGRTLLAVLALTLGYRSWVYWTQDVSQLAIGYLYGYALPGRLFEFVLGMAAALALAGRKSEPGPAWIRRYLFGAAALGVAGLIVAHAWTPFSPITDVIWGLAFFCLVMYAGGRSAMGRCWLETRPLVALGLISYSVYLIHEPFITRGYLFTQRLHLSPVLTLLVFELAVAPLLIALGALYFRAVEARFLSRR